MKSPKDLKMLRLKNKLFGGEEGQKHKKEQRSNRTSKNFFFFFLRKMSLGSEKKNLATLL